jgi:hypothetical protein
VDLVASAVQRDSSAGICGISVVTGGADENLTNI